MSEHEGTEAIIEESAKEFAGSHSTLQEPIEIWFDLWRNDGWYWCTTDLVNHGPYATSKMAFEAAASYFFEEGPR
jgi:hypothetical protein